MNKYMDIKVWRFLHESVGIEEFIDSKGDAMGDEAIIHESEFSKCNGNNSNDDVDPYQEPWA